ncbi:uncharacterized protein isoform X1 [Leptinotarsa decemlineata]|uniref:uncharacterized protein isoform X1 n=1 Tax=Leptinotarsa decemlineata TaxID=7539 RepID=UPI003D30D7E3
MEETTSSMEGPYPGCRSFIREAFSKRNFPSKAVHGIMASVTPSTLKQYDVWFRKWWDYCAEHQQNPITSSLENIINFLDLQFQQNKSFSSINSCKSAISFFMPIKQEDETIIRRYIRGIYNHNPPKPKYEDTWDPHIVLSKLKLWQPLKDQSLEKLTLKMVTLLALVTTHRVQTLTKIKLENINIHDKVMNIKIADRIKTSGPKKPQPILNIPFNLEEPELCLASIIGKYIEITEPLRPHNETRLIITYKKPFHAATAQSVSRWIKTTLKMCGIDTDKYGSHSTRHAATSAAYRSGMSIAEIRKKAGWSEKSNTFNTFYNKPLA